MDRIVHEYEEAKAKQKRRRTTNFEIDVDIMVLMLTLIARINHCSAQIERPIRRAPTELGYEYIQKAMKEDSQHFRELYRMSPHAFLKLCDIIIERTNIADTRNTSVEEMLATFLLTVGQNSRYTQTRDTFNRSAFAASTNFNKILRALCTIAPSFMVKPGNTVPTKIKESTRYYPYFKDCVGALDGTHIPAMVVGDEVASYRNRKGHISQNVLAACNFDLEFIYILSGWEGSAHNAKVLNDALTRTTNRFKVPEGKYYLVNCGYANRSNFLAPYRSTRYHLQEFKGEGNDPANKEELFNLRHASLRNVIERIFGIFKSRFLIFKSAPPFPFKRQVELVLACAALHNFLRKECRSDQFDPEERRQENVASSNTTEEGSQENVASGSNAQERSQENDEANSDAEELVGTQVQQREFANNWRATIATNMWADANDVGY